MPAPVRIELATFPAGTVRRSRVLFGQAIAITAAVLDAAGAAVSPSGLRFTVRRPDGLVQEGAGVETLGVGLYRLTIEPDMYGEWRVQVSVAGPYPAASVVEWDCWDGQVIPAPPATPVLVTEDLGAVVTQTGGTLTVKRITELPAMGALDGTEQFVGVQANNSARITTAALAAMVPPLLAAATQDTAGLLSAADKAKLDGVAAGATRVTAPGDIGAAAASALDAKAANTFTAPVAGAVARTVAAKLGESISVRDFGAVGDGAADDWSAIQAAIDAVSAAGGGEVVIPRPTGAFWRISQALRARSGVTIRVPGNATRIVCTGDAAAPFNQWPANGCLLFSSLTTENRRDAPSVAIGAVAVGDAAVTCTTPAQAGGFVDGDEVLVETVSTFTVGSDPIPTWCQRNKVAGAPNAATGAVPLLHPIDTAQASVVLRRLTNTGLNWTIGGGVDTGEPMWATSDAAVIGGTWETTVAAAPFSAGGGLLNGVIDVFKVAAGRGVGYGNAFAHCRLRAAIQVLRNTTCELAYGSHHNDLDTGRVTLTGTAAPGFHVAITEAARANLVRVRGIDIGAAGGAELVLLNTASGNRVEVGEIRGGAITGSAVKIADTSYAGTRPDTADNRVQVEVSRLASQQAYVSIQGGTASKCTRNVVLPGHYYGTVTVNGVVLATCERNTIEGVVGENGAATLPSGTAGSRYRDCYFPNGLATGPDTPQLQRGTLQNLESAATRLADTITTAWSAATVTSASAFSKTVTVPAGALAAGDVVEIELFLQSTGAAAPKTAEVAFNGVSLGAMTLAAGGEAGIYRATLIATSSTAVIGFADTRAVAPASVTVTGLNLATTAYPITLNVPATAGADTVLVRHATLQVVRKTRNSVAA